MSHDLTDLTISQHLIYQKLEYICLSFLRLNQKWNGPRCITLSGPEGSGKSFILSRLLFLLQSKNAVFVSFSATAYQDRGTDNTSNMNNESDINRFTNILNEVIDCFQAKVFPSSRLNTCDNGTSRPCFIFIDDLDAIYESYSRSSSIQSTIESIVSRERWLLHELTQFSRHFPILIIAATTIPFHQLPQPSQCNPLFETSISIPTPSFEERKQIICKFISSTFAKDITLEIIDDSFHDDALMAWSTKLSSLTASYQFGDLVILIQRAWHYYCGVVTSFTAHDSRIFQWKYVLQVLTMTLPKHLQNLNRKLPFAHVSSYALSNHQLCWDDFCGYDELKVKLQRLLLRLEHGRSSIGGIVLHGESGTGKSYLASIIAAETKMNFISVQATDILSKYYSESESRIRQLFSSAREATPCVLFIDEFDAIAHKRSVDEESTGLNSRILSTMLNELDGITTRQQANSIDDQNLLVIVSCQDISHLDDALIRTGRLHHHFELQYPSKSDILAMLKRRLVFSLETQTVDAKRENQILCADDVHIDKVLDMISNVSSQVTGASIKSFINGVIRESVREHILEGESDIQPCIYWRHFASYYHQNQ